MTRAQLRRSRRRVRLIIGLARLLVDDCPAVSGVTDPMLGYAERVQAHLRFIEQAKGKRRTVR